MTATCADLCILDFGAAFDGSKDDTKAWQDAMDHLRTMGGVG